MIKLKYLLLTVALLILFPAVKSQTISVNDSIENYIQARMQENPFFKRNEITVNEEDVMELSDALPAFGVYKDTYFTTGIPLNESINRNTADVMFQISIRQRLTKSRLPFNTFLFLTYTQKSFWDIYADSAPFRDNNYNPAIGLGKYIIHNNKFKGTVFLQIEHESNGKDGDDSRSWNMISLSTKYFYNPQLVFGAKVWIPIVDGENNKDLVDYRGIGYLTADYKTKGQRWWFSAELNPRKGLGNINTIITAGFKVSKNSNQYLFARFFNGKGESLIDYNKYDLNVRFGFCIKPDFGSIF